MPICSKCNFDNPPGKIFCANCGERINRPEREPELDPVELQEKIQALGKELVRDEEEIKKLHERLEAVTLERDELAGKHPEVEAILRQLDEKDRALQDALQQLDALRNIVPSPPPNSPDVKPRLLIESYPIPNPAFGMTFDDHHNSLDLSTTGFRIRASLERNADGSVGLVIHPGATINIKTPARKQWQRLDGGARLSTEVGMILFDPKGAVNARFERSS
jgi:uncharacterized Zn finger protein (UPF0148 family)